MWMADRLYKYPTQEVFRYHFKPFRPVAAEMKTGVTEKHKELRFKLGSMTDRPASKQDNSGKMVRFSFFLIVNIIIIVVIIINIVIRKNCQCLNPFPNVKFWTLPS